MPTEWYTRRREEDGFRPKSAQLYGQMAVEWLTWEAERTGLSIRHQVNGRGKMIGKYWVDGWCSADGVSVPRMLLPRLSALGTRNERRQREVHESTKQDYRLPATLCQSRRDVGMSVERREKICGGETVPGRRVSSSTTTRAMERDATSDIDRLASRYPVRHDRVRRSRTGRIARAVRRDAARVQERRPDSRRSQSFHASLRQRSRHQDSSATHSRG